LNRDVPHGTGHCAGSGVPAAAHPSTVLDRVLDQILDQILDRPSLT
jgi:hypothetical protein